MTRSRRHVLLLAGLLGLSVLSCGREVTGPNDGLVYGRGRIADLNFAPEFPALPGANAASDLVPFTRVRVTLLRTDGTVAKDTLVDFPSTADSIALALSVPLPITASDTGITLGLSMAYVNAQGDTVFRAGPQAITARPSGANGGQSQPITIPVRWVPPAGSPLPSSVTLTPATGTAVAGQTTALTAVARDAQGNAIPGIPVGFSSLDTTRASFASVGSNVVTWKAKRGTALVVASLLNGPADTSSFEISLPGSLLVPVSGTGQSALIGTALSQPVTWRVVASDSVPVAGVPVLFGVTTGGGTLGAVADTSDANGLVSTAWTLGSLVGTQSITATLGNGSAATSVVTATGSAPISTQLAITSAPTTVTAGATIAPVTVAVRDANGVLTPLFTGPVSLALNAGATGATLTGTTAVNAVAGVATFTNLSIQKAAAGLTLTATSGTLASATSAAFAVTPAVATSITVVSGNAQTGTLGQPLADSIVVEVKDAFANVVPGTTVTFSTITFASSVSPTSAITDSLGRARTRWTIGTSVGPQSARAALPGGANVTFTATGVAGAAVKLQLFTDPLSINAAGTPIAPPISYLAVDAVGAVATSFTTPVTLVFAANPAGATLGGRTTVTPVDGIITFDSVFVTTVGSGYRFTTAGSGLPSDTTGGINIVSGTAGQLATVSGDAQSGTVATALAAPFVVRVTDVFGNPVANQTVTWAVSSGSGTLSAATSLTNTAGNASSTLTLGATPGTVVVTASVGSISGSPQSFSATAVAGAATELVLTSGPIGPQVVGVPLPDVVVEARDAQGNRATSFTGTVRADVAGTSPDSAQATAVAGVATFSGAFFETAGTYSVTFSFPGLTSAVSNTFVVSPGAATLMVAPGPLTLNGTAGLALTSPNAAVVRIEDAFANAVPGTPVGFVLVRGADTLATAQVAADTAGLAAWQPVMPQTVGSASIIARVAGLTNSPITFFVNVFTGPAVRLSMVGEPITTTAGTTLNAVSVDAKDQFGNRRVAFNAQVTVTVDSGPAGAVLSGTTTVTPVSGISTFSTLSLDKAGTYRLRFSSAGLSDAVSANFSILTGAPASVTVLAGNAQTDTASTALPDSLVVRVTDGSGNPVSGATVTWAATSGGGALSPIIDTTDATGRAAAQWTLGAVLGAQTATATVGALTPASFTATAVSGSNIVTWTGAVSGAWETAGNWDTGTLPGPTSPVVIPVGAANDPVVNSPSTIGSLTVASEVSVTTNAILTVQGAVDIAQFSSVGGSARVDLVGAGTQSVRGAFSGAVRVNGGNYVLGGATSISGNLEVYDGDLSVGNFALTIGGGLLTGAGGTFTMQGTGTVDVAGYVNFFGNSTAGRLTNGLMRVGGDFEQLDSGPGSPEQRSFVASGDHVVALVGTGRQRVRFDSPDTTVTTTCATSCFATLRANKPSGSIVFSTGAKALGDLDLAGGDSISAPGAILVAGGAARLNSFLVRVGTIAWRDSLFVQGEGRVIDSLIAWGNGSVLTNVPRVRTAVRGTHRITGTLQGRVDVTGQLDVDGTARILGPLSTLGSGTLRMTDAIDSLHVDSAATFSGGSTATLLSAGTLVLGGNLLQSGDPQSYYGSGTHLTVLTGGGAQTTSFTNRGGIGAFSHFQDLEIAQPPGASIALPGGGYVMGQLRESMGTPVQFTAPTTQRLVVGGTNLSDVRFDRVQLLVQNGAAVEGLQGLTFGTFAAGDIQLFIARNGGAVLLDGITFETVPDTTQGGAYLYLDDLAADGDTLTVTVNATAPSAHGGAVQVLPDARLVGWEATAPLVWTGAAGTSSWTTAANWSTGSVPTSADSVVVPAVATLPVIPAATTLRALVITATSPITMPGGTVTITERLITRTDVGGISCGFGGGISFSTTAAKSVAGITNGCLVRILGGTVTAVDSLTVNGGDLRVEGTAVLDLGGEIVNVSGFFSTDFSGRLRMQSPGATLRAISASFGGGSTSGELTDGVLSLSGGFSQLGNVESFAPSGAHETVLTGSTTQFIMFANPGSGSGSSHFHHLRLAHQPEGGAEIQSLTVATGQVRESVTWPAVIRSNIGNEFVSAGADVNGLRVDRVNWTLADGAAVTSLQNVTFDSLASTITPFTIARAGGTVSLVSPTFAVVPTGTAVYLVANDIDGATGGLLTVSVANPVPSASGGRVTTLNGAIVSGWASAPLLQWTGAVNQSWGTAGNWNLNRLPLPTDSVIVNGNVTVNITSASTVAWLNVGETGSPVFNIQGGATLTVDSVALFSPTTSVNMTGGTIAGGGVVLLNGPFNWSGGSMTGDGGTGIGSGATANVTGAPSMNTRTLIVNGTLNLGGTAFNGSNTAGQTPAISVGVGGTMNFTSTTSYFSGNGVVNLVASNGGIIRKATSAGLVRVDWPITNSGGIIEVADDTLDLRNALNHVGGTISVLSNAALINGGQTTATGNITIAAGGRMQLQSGGISADAGNHIFAPTSSITGLGRLMINSADTTRIQGLLDIDSLTVQNGQTWFESADTMFVTRGAYLGGGFLRGSGVLGVRGDFVLNAGNIVGTGVMSVRPTGTLTLRGMNGWKVDVAGKAIWGDYDMTFGQDTLNGIPYASMQVRSGGILEVAHGTTTPRELFALGSATPPNVVFTVDAGGTVRKISGTGVSNFRNRFLMSGVFDVQAGNVNVQGTCAMSGSKTGAGQLTGNCGTF